MLSSRLVIIPTYNEIDNIELIVNAVLELKPRFDLMIVDDNSPDGTAGKVRELQKLYPQRIFLEIRPKKQGLGRAYIHGFKAAQKYNYTYIFEMDADFSHNPVDLIRLYETAEAENLDLVIGSRYISGVNVVNWPLVRVLLSYFASVYVKIVTGLPIKDATAGFKCYRASALAKINLDKIKFVGYAFQIEMKFVFWRNKMQLKEIPVIFTDRKRGQSKMSFNVLKEAIWGILFLHWRHRKPMRIRD